MSLDGRLTSSGPCPTRPRSASTDRTRLRRRSSLVDLLGAEDQQRAAWAQASAAKSEHPADSGPSPTTTMMATKGMLHGGGGVVHVNHVTGNNPHFNGNGGSNVVNGTIPSMAMSPPSQATQHHGHGHNHTHNHNHAHNHVPRRNSKNVSGLSQLSTTAVAGLDHQYHGGSRGEAEFSAGSGGTGMMKDNSDIGNRGVFPTLPSIASVTSLPPINSYMPDVREQGSLSAPLPRLPSPYALLQGASSRSPPDSPQPFFYSSAPTNLPSHKYSFSPLSTGSPTSSGSPSPSSSSMSPASSHSPSPLSFYSTIATSTAPRTSSPLVRPRGASAPTIELPPIHTIAPPMPSAPQPQPTPPPPSYHTHPPNNVRGRSASASSAPTTLSPSFLYPPTSTPMSPVSSPMQSHPSPMIQVPYDYYQPVMRSASPSKSHLYSETPMDSRAAYTLASAMDTAIQMDTPQPAGYSPSRSPRQKRTSFKPEVQDLLNLRTATPTRSLGMPFKREKEDRGEEEPPEVTSPTRGGVIRRTASGRLSAPPVRHGDSIVNATANVTRAIEDDASRVHRPRRRSHATEVAAKKKQDNVSPKQRYKLRRRLSLPPQKYGMSLLDMEAELAEDDDEEEDEDEDFDANGKSPRGANRRAQQTRQKEREKEQLASDLANEWGKTKNLVSLLMASYREKQRLSIELGIPTETEPQNQMTESHGGGSGSSSASPDSSPDMSRPGASPQQRSSSPRGSPRKQPSGRKHSHPSIARNPKSRSMPNLFDTLPQEVGEVMQALKLVPPPKLTQRFGETLAQAGPEEAVSLPALATLASSLSAAATSPPLGEGDSSSSSFSGSNLDRAKSRSYDMTYTRGLVSDADSTRIRGIERKMKKARLSSASESEDDSSTAASDDEAESTLKQRKGRVTFKTSPPPHSHSAGREGMRMDSSQPGGNDHVWWPSPRPSENAGEEDSER